MSERMTETAWLPRARINAIVASSAAAERGAANKPAIIVRARVNLLRTVQRRCQLLAAGIIGFVGARSGSSAFQVGDGHGAGGKTTGAGESLL
jgi:hypothetical protein